MYILAVDTSTSVCSVALTKDEQIIAERNVDKGLTHSETLMSMIDEVIKEAKLDKNDINLVIAGKGPGSFTGLRIGVTVANTFAQVLGIAAIGVVTLDGLAASVPNTNNLVCPIIDAKGGKIYTCVYRRDKNTQSVMKYELITREQLDEILECESDVIYVDESETRATNLIKYYLENKVQYENEPRYISPLYIKKSQAEG